MEQYIKKSAIVAEIEKRLKANGAFDEVGDEAWAEDKGMCEAYKSILSFLNTLEVKEVNLEKELDFVKDAYYYFTSDERSSIKKVAKHFFELGLQVNNPVTAADRGMAEEIIINLKRVEQDYYIDLTREMEWLRNLTRKGE